MADSDPETDGSASVRGDRPSAPAFAIPRQPQRRYPRGGGVEYVGDVTFTLRPAEEGTEPAAADDATARESPALRPLVEGVLADGPYQFGDFLELPMPLYLVRDRDTADTFRVTIRDGAVRLHVLPATESAGLRRFYERLTDRAGGTWTVRRRVEDPQST